MTLLEERLARTPEGVAKAVREGRKLVLYAIPGGPRSAEEWKAAQVGLRGDQLLEPAALNMRSGRLYFVHLGATWFRRGRFSGRAASRGPRSAS